MHRLNKSTLVFAIAVALLTAFVTGCVRQVPKPEEQQPPVRPARGKVLRLHTAVKPASLDPARVQNLAEAQLVWSIYERLVTYDFQTLQVEPAIATSWDLLEEGKRAVFRLEKGKKFHNGREVTAEDVKYSWERLLVPGGPPVAQSVFRSVAGIAEKLAGQANQVTGIRVVDPYVIEIEFLEPDPAFIGRLGHPVLSIVDRDSVETSGTYGAPGTVDEPAGQVNGTGAFQLVEWVDGQLLVLEANPYYLKMGEYPSRVEWMIEPDVEIAINDFRAGYLDLVQGLTPGMLERQVEGHFLQSREVASQLRLMDYLFLNTDDQTFEFPYLFEILRASLDTNQLAAMVQAMPAENRYQPELAVTLLTDAGFGEREGPPPLVLGFDPSAHNLKLAQGIKSQLGRVGLEVRFAGANEPANLYLVNWEARTPAEPYPAGERVIPLVKPQFNYLVSSDVSGLELNELGMLSLERVKLQ